MNWKDVPVEQIFKAVGVLCEAFGNNAHVAIGQINTNPRIARRFAELCLESAYQESTSQSRAKKIMGKNFIGIKEACDQFGLSPSRRVLAYMNEIPFSSEQLERHRQTHVLVAYFPVSYANLCMATSVSMPKGQRLFHKDNPLTKGGTGRKENAGLPEWHLVRKSSVPKSLDKSLSLQRKVAFEGKSDYQPRPMLMVYSIIGHFLTTGERLFVDELVRTDKVCSVGKSVVVGKFGPEGLYIGEKMNSVRSESVGIASEVLPFED